MRSHIFLPAALLLLYFSTTTINAQVNTSNPCIESMSTEQRNILPRVEEGKMIFNTSTGCLNYYQDKRWRVFCEEEKKKDEDVVFDPEKGSLKYRINGQWYEFAVTSSFSEEKEVSQTKEVAVVISQDSLNKLPADCRKKPTRPYAGKDLVGYDIVNLEGNEPIHGKGRWDLINGEGGQFVDRGVHNTQFAGIQGNTYFLKWSIFTSCDTFSDEVMVMIRPPCDPEPSLSFAGYDQFNVEEAYLTANNPNYGKGSWVIVSGLGGLFDDANNPRTRFSGKAGETYVLRWMIRNECGLTMDDVIIKIKPPCTPMPLPADAGRDQMDVDDCFLKANNPGKGSGKWTVVEGSKGRFQRSDSSITHFFGEPGKSYVLRWTISTPCGSTIDEVNVKFSASCPSEIIDLRDGQRYKTVKLAGQCWMAENLNYKPADTESYCYEDLSGFCSEFGRLYPWKSAMNGDIKEADRGICPEGWHLPSDAEWQHLVDSSGLLPKEFIPGGTSGFDIRLGGSRYINGTYYNRGEYAYYWTSTGQTKTTAWNRYFPEKGASSDHYATDMRHSFSVRCVKDAE